VGLIGRQSVASKGACFAKFSIGPGAGTVNVSGRVDWGKRLTRAKRTRCYDVAEMSSV
jgi:hypothetical protein